LYGTHAPVESGAWPGGQVVPGGGGPVRLEGDCVLDELPLLAFRGACEAARAAARRAASACPAACPARAAL